jgi:hypothetical protein
MALMRLLFFVLVSSVHLLVEGSECAVGTCSLLPLLSPGAKIDDARPVAPLRWSEYKAPRPGAVIHPATEHDVETTVRLISSLVAELVGLNC